MAPIESDRFETRVFYVEALGQFHTIDYCASPSAGDWVVVKCPDEPEIAIEPFCGQPVIGVAKILEFYQLRQSEQWNPRPVSLVPIDRINQAPPPEAVSDKSTSSPQRGHYMKIHLLPLVLVIAGACASSGAPSAMPAKLVAQSITPAEAKNHVGKRKTICGVVASANYAAQSRSQPTFLNLDEPYPRHIFTAVIWIENRPKFGTPETTLKGKRICVSGLIDQYRGVPQIVLGDAP